MSSIEIPLTRGKFAIIDRDDLEFVMRAKWSYSASGKSRSHYYAKSSSRIMGGYNVGMHSYIMGCPPKMVVDHINGNGLDNRRENLRVCSQISNSYNRAKSNKKTSSKYKGVYKRPGNKKWAAVIQHNKKSHWLGFFHTEDDAARAYNKKALELHGEFAHINKGAPRKVRLGVAWK